MRAFDGEVVVIALREDNLYQVTFTKVCEMHVANVAQTSTIDGALELWHRRLGHLNVKGVHAFQNMVSGMNLGNMPCTSRKTRIYNWCLRLVFNRMRHFTTILLLVA